MPKHDSNELPDVLYRDILMYLLVFWDRHNQSVCVYVVVLEGIPLQPQVERFRLVGTSHTVPCVGHVVGRSEALKPDCLPITVVMKITCVCSCHGCKWNHLPYINQLHIIWLLSLIRTPK